MEMTRRVFSSAAVAAALAPFGEAKPLEPLSPGIKISMQVDEHVSDEGHSQIPVNDSCGSHAPETSPCGGSVAGRWQASAGVPTTTTHHRREGGRLPRSRIPGHIVSAWRAG